MFIDNISHWTQNTHHRSIYQRYRISLPQWCLHWNNGTSYYLCIIFTLFHDPICFYYYHALWNQSQIKDSSNMQIPALLSWFCLMDSDGFHSCWSVTVSPAMIDLWAILFMKQLGEFSWAPTSERHAWNSINLRIWIEFSKSLSTRTSHIRS